MNIQTARLIHSLPALFLFFVFGVVGALYSWLFWGVWWVGIPIGIAVLFVIGMLGVAWDDISKEASEVIRQRASDDTVLKTLEEVGDGE